MSPSTQGIQAAALLQALRDVAPQRRAEAVRAAGRPDEVLRALGDEAERLAVVEVSRGLEAADLVVDLAETAGSPAARARARRARARALAYAGRHEEALGACREAAALARGAGEAVEAARCRLAAVPALAELGRLEEAIAEGRAARDAFAEAGEEELAARADANLGTVFQRRGELHEALRHFERARASLGRDPVTAGQLDSNRGEALVHLNDFIGAETAYRRALETLEANGVRWGAAIVEGNLAELAVRQGRLDRALYHFERARRHIESDASAGHLARLLAEQAEAIAILGLADEALREYVQALPRLDACGLALEAARARAGLGALLARLGRRDEAENELAAAARAFEALGHKASGARVDVVRAELAAASGRVAEAAALLESALRVAGDRPLDGAVVRFHRARLALQGGDPGAARAELADALRVVRRLDVAPLAADLLHTSGLVALRQGRFDEAVADLAEAVEQVERVRGSLQAARFRAAFLGDRLAVYQDLVGTLLRRGGPDAVTRAFRAAEQAKSRSLLDALGGAVDLAAHPASSADPAEARLLARVGRLREDVNALYSRLEAAQQEGPGPWLTALREREAELAGLEARLSSARGVAGLYAPPADLESVRASLPEGAMLLEYFVVGGELIAFTVDGDGAAAHRLEVGTDALGGALRRMRFQMGRVLRPGGAGAREARLADDARGVLGELHAMLLAPLRDAMGGSTSLVVVPHGALHLVPFAALWSGGRHVVETHEVLTAPSAAVLVHLARGRREEAPGAALVVGVADELAPRIAVEARRVADVLGTDALLLDGDATAARIIAEAPRARLIHLACHGRFSLEAPQASGLRLADRWLTLPEIYPLRLAADAVILSGCETGRNIVTAGDELVGLLHAFLAAGARAVVASHWRAGDETTASFMTAFYEAWRGRAPGGAGLCRALGEAQRRLLGEGLHPAFWAPFFLSGHAGA